MSMIRIEIPVRLLTFVRPLQILNEPGYNYSAPNSYDQFQTLSLRV